MTTSLAQEKTKTEQNDNLRKTWVEKGEKKYNVDYKDGVVIFKNWDGKGQIHQYSLIEDPELEPYAKTPLLVMMHAYKSGFGDGVYLVYQEGLVFMMPVRGNDGVAHVRYSLNVKPEKRTWTMKGEKKYDIEYKDGIVTFMNYDGKGNNLKYSLIDNLELCEFAETPLIAMEQAIRDGYFGVYLVYKYGMIFIRPNISERGEPCVTYSLIGVKDIRK